MRLSTTLDKQTKRGPTRPGKKKHDAILKTAMQIASQEGLDALTIGRLANMLDMSKSGLFGHFGSKENLQLETIEAARNIFIAQVVTPAIEESSGIEMISKLCDLWFSYVERCVFSGGCFFLTATHEYKNKPGAIRDALSQNMQDWLDMIARMVLKGQREESLQSNVDPEQIAFELNAIAMASNWQHQLFDRPEAFEQGRAAAQRMFTDLATSAETRKLISISRD